VWLAEGFVGRAGAPGKNFGGTNKESLREEHTLYLKVRCGSGCRYGAWQRHTKKRAKISSYLPAREKQTMTPAY